MIERNLTELKCTAKLKKCTFGSKCLSAKKTVTVTLATIMFKIHDYIGKITFVN